MKEFIRKYLSGQSDRNEQAQLLQWLRGKGNLDDFRKEKAEWEREASSQPLSSLSSSSWSSLQTKLLQEVQEKLQRSTIRLKYFQYAAVVLVVFSVTSVAIDFSAQKPARELVYTTVKAEPGQIANVVLPDKSEVWINSGSYISYNNEFSQSNREIRMEGEVFFSVQKNPELPLIVKNVSAPDIKVTGTKFNVAGYPDEHFFHVTLQEGHIELNSSGRSIPLHPGEQAVFNRKTNELQVNKVDVGRFISWKDGQINFYNVPLEEVVIRLGKRYNQRFVLDNEVKQLQYTYTVTNEPLSEVLLLMEKITPVRIRQKGEVIYIMSRK